jgi:hypothetical protein
VRQGAVGMDYVIVNGEVLLDHGAHTGALPGQTLRGDPCITGSARAGSEGSAGRAARAMNRGLPFCARWDT